MAIYNLSEEENKQSEQIAAQEESAPVRSWRDALLSTLVVRLLFLVLLVADGVWAVVASLRIVVAFIAWATTAGKSSQCLIHLSKGWITLRRAFVCGASLLLALFNPSFGIMIACTYFLMYDKQGVHEVIPASIREQFKEFLP